MPQPRGPNVRSARTRQQLRDALLELAGERDFADIDVSDVTRRANLNRSTFYLHFPDKDALVEETLSVLLRELNESGQALLTGQHPDDVRTRADWRDTLFHRIAERPALFLRLLRQTGPETFSRQLQEIHEAGFIALWRRLGYEELPDGPPLRVRARFAAAGVRGIVLQWLESGMRESPDQVSDWVWAIGFPNHPLAAREHAASTS